MIDFILLNWKMAIEVILNVTHSISTTSPYLLVTAYLFLFLMGLFGHDSSKSNTYFFNKIFKTTRIRYLRFFTLRVFPRKPYNILLSSLILFFGFCFAFFLYLLFFDLTFFVLFTFPIALGSYCRVKTSK